jgi:tRNA threonylcarbamoyladenosine biosynthesis protein TsaB
MLLLIDTSTKNAGVATFEQGQFVQTKTWFSHYNHSQQLFIALEEMFGSEPDNFSNISGVGIALGPGGYSSVRSGISVAKTIAFANKIPIYGVNTLDLECFPMQTSGMKACSIIEAGKGMVSYAEYDTKGDKINEDKVGPIDEVISQIPVETIICGEAVNAYQQDLTINNRHFIRWSSQLTRMWSLGITTETRENAGAHNSLNEIEAIYARPPSIGQPSKKKNSREKKWNER